MSFKAVVDPILRDEALTRGLGDAEARMLIEWLVERAEQHHAEQVDAPRFEAAMLRLRRRARGIARFVELWSVRGDRGAALQLAVTEKLDWPLPTRSLEPCDLMAHALMHEDTPPEEWYDGFPDVTYHEQ